jgi:hypothetical protein
MGHHPACPRLVFVAHRIHMLWQSGWWFGTFFSHILGIIIPTDELIFFRGVETTNQQFYAKK